MKLTDLMKVQEKKEEAAAEEENKPEEHGTYTPEQLHAVWNEFAEQRRKFQAEYQLLSQPYENVDTRIILHLLSPIQETLLNNIKSELTGYLRERLKNSSIQVEGSLLESDDKKMMYTSRDKFEYLLSKNPMLQEMKERLGLDSDY